MSNTVGLQAKLDLSQWQGQVQRYMDDCQRMTKSTSGAGNSMGGAFSGMSKSVGMLGNIGSALGNVATVAGGIIVANVFGRLAEGITSFASAGLNAVGNAQMLEASLSSLMVSNNMYQQSTEKMTVAIAQTPEELAKNAQRLTDLQLARQTDIAQIQEQKQKIIQLTAAYGDNGLNVQVAKAKLAEMENQVSKTDAEIANLSNTTTEYTEVTEKSYKQVMSQAEAQNKATRETAYLMDAISKIAVVSPFETETVEQVAKYAVGAGMGAKQTEEFTAAFLDMAASVGIGSDTLGFAADQLLQVKKIGKLTTIDLRQLRRMGIDLEKVIGVQMGMSIEEFNQKAEQTPEIFDDLFKALTTYSQNTFAGTSQKMAQSVKGLGSTLNDVFVIGAREFFRPLVETASPVANQIIGKLSDAVLGGQMASLGQKAAEYLGEGISKGRAIVNAFGRSFDEGFRMIGYFISKAWPDIQAALGTGAMNIAGLLGISPDAITQIQGFFGQVSEVFSQVQAGQGGDLLAGWATQLIAGIPGALQGVLTGIDTFLQTQWPTIQTTVNGWADSFWDWAKTASAKATEFLAGISVAIMTWAMSPEASVQIASVGQSLGNALISGMQQGGQNAEGLGQVVLNLATGLSLAIVAVGGTLIVVGGQLVANIIAGMAESFGAKVKPWTFQQLRDFSGWFFTGVNWGAVGSGLMSKISNGISSMGETISGAFKTGVEAWKKVITDAKWIDIGKAVISGLLKGLKDNSAKVLEYLKELAGSMISDTMASLGIQSPSTVFAEIGSNIVAGLVQGVDTSSATFQKSLDKLLGVNRNLTSVNGIAGAARDDVEKYLDEQDITKDKGKFALRELGEVFRANSKEILGATNRLQAFKDAARKMGKLGSGLFGSGDQGKIIQQSFSRFLSAYDKYAVIFQEKLQQSFIEAGKKAVSVGGSMIDLARQGATQLNTEVDSLVELLNSGNSEIKWNDQILSAAEATDLLNQKMAEQRDIQDDLAELSQKQNQLGYLQKQLDLLTTVKSAGLNVKDIFGGLGFGANMSTSGLIDATNRTVQAMLGQANADLGSLGLIKNLTGGQQVVSGSGSGNRAVITAGGSNNKQVTFNVSLANGMDVSNFIALVKREVAAEI